MRRKQIWSLLICSLLVCGLTACKKNGNLNETQSLNTSEHMDETEISTEISSADASEADIADEKILVVENGDITIRFRLNDSAAADQLYDMLPMTVEVRNFDTMEKLFHQEGLDLSDAPMSPGELGDLAYYEPTGNVIFYYDYLGPYDGLYALGTAIEGEDKIQELYGETTLTRE